MMTAEQRKAVAERLALIEEAGGGRLTPDAVVADAKDPESPLHDHFTWDVKKAAYAHWLDQARELITSVRVIIKTDKSMVRSVFYVRDPSADAKQQGYVNVQRLRGDADMAREALVDEFSRVASMLHRARELARVLGAESEIEPLLSQIVDLRKRFELPSVSQ